MQGCSEECVNDGRSNQGLNRTRSIGMMEDKVAKVYSRVIINYIIPGSQMHRERDIGTWLE